MKKTTHCSLFTFCFSLFAFSFFCFTRQLHDGIHRAIPANNCHIGDEAYANPAFWTSWDMQVYSCTSDCSDPPSPRSAC